jgi:hypothetical protein
MAKFSWEELLLGFTFGLVVGSDRFIQLVKGFIEFLRWLL